MPIRKLRTLVAVAETKTFSAAADVVHITHVAVSQRMHALEADLGLTLFDRSTRTPKLTPAGQKRRLIASIEEPDNDPITLLETRPFIRFECTAFVGALIDNWILSRRIHVTEATELYSPEAITSMVHSNLGVSIVPDPVVKLPDTIPVNSLGLGADALHRTLGLVRQGNQIKTKPIDALQAGLLSVIETATQGESKKT